MQGRAEHPRPLGDQLGLPLREVDVEAILFAGALVRRQSVWSEKFRREVRGERELRVLGTDPFAVTVRVGGEWPAHGEGDQRSLPVLPAYDEVDELLEFFVIPARRSG